jgi:biotin carboxylase
MKKLAILGASYLQLPLVEKARQMGIETHVFAWDNPEAVCKSVADFFYPVSVLEKDAILEKCREIQIDGITTIATDICIPVIAYVAEELHLPGNSLETALKATHKGLMRQAFEKNGVNSPKSGTFTPESALPEFDFPLIVKPTDRSGSRGVTLVRNVSGLRAAIERACEESIEGKAVVEEYIEGDEVSVESISFQNEHYILAITDKVTTGSPYFVELEHHQPSVLSDQVQQNIRVETLKALKALQIENGASHAEFKITASGRVVAIEVGARLGGDFKCRKIWSKNRLEFIFYVKKIAGFCLILTEKHLSLFRRKSSTTI